MNPPRTERTRLVRIADIPFRVWLLLAFTIVWLLSWIGAASTIDLVLQHTPTVALLAALVTTGVRQPLSNTSYVLLLAFLLLHVVGARYLYSNVPYDDWCEMLIGVRPGEAMGFSRNHYDRFAHLCFGLLLVYPAREIVERLTGMRGGWTWVAAVGVIVVFGTIYELMEWAVAMLMAPDTAEKYNGQQGDPWDAHRDMALALAGGIASAIAGAAVSRKRSAEGDQQAER